MKKLPSPRRTSLKVRLGDLDFISLLISSIGRKRLENSNPTLESVPIESILCDKSWFSWRQIDGRVRYSIVSVTRNLSSSPALLLYGMRSKCWPAGTPACGSSHSCEMSDDAQEFLLTFSEFLCFFARILKGQTEIWWNFESQKSYFINWKF